MFELKQEHRMIEQAIREYAEKEILPKVPAFESGREMPFDLMRRMMTDVMGAGWIRESLNKRADKMESGRWNASGSRGAMDIMEGMDPLLVSHRAQGTLPRQSGILHVLGGQCGPLRR